MHGWQLGFIMGKQLGVGLGQHRADSLSGQAVSLGLHMGKLVGNDVGVPDYRNSGGYADRRNRSGRRRGSRVRFSVSQNILDWSLGE